MGRIFIANDAWPDKPFMEVESAERAAAECDDLRVFSDYCSDYTARDENGRVVYSTKDVR